MFLSVWNIVYGFCRPSTLTARTAHRKRVLGSQKVLVYALPSFQLRILLVSMGSLYTRERAMVKNHDSFSYLIKLENLRIIINKLLCHLIQRYL